MTSVPARLATFAALLVAVFGAAALLGGIVDPSGASTAEPAHADRHGANDHASEADSTSSGVHGAAMGATTAPGLSVAEGGLRLALIGDRTTGVGRTEMAFRILGRNGRAVREFDVEHAKRMHLIVVRRDLRGFEHLHPTMDTGGTWRVEADLRRPGTYRVFADFRTADGKRTLGADLHVPGNFQPEPIPAPARTAETDSGLQVSLQRDGDKLSFTVRRDGRPVNGKLEPYLGAKGHLVALRAGDLAYLHTHPDAGRLAFEADLPTAGVYRLWVQFQLDGRVHTAAFTQEVTA